MSMSGPLDTKMVSRSERPPPLITLPPETERALRKSCSQLFEKPSSKRRPSQPIPPIKDTYKQHQRSQTSQTQAFSLSTTSTKSVTGPNTANFEVEDSPKGTPRRSRAKTNESRHIPRTLDVENIPPEIPTQFATAETARKVSIGEARASRIPLEPLRQLSIPGPEGKDGGNSTSGNRISRAGIIARPKLVDVSTSPSSASPISRPKTSGGIRDRTSTYNWLEEEFKRADLDREVAKLDLIERPRTAHNDNRKSTYSVAASAKSLPLEMRSRDLPPLPTGTKYATQRSRTDVVELAMEPGKVKSKMSFSFWKLKFAIGKNKKPTVANVTVS